MDPDPTTLASVIMQVIGTLYGIFIAITILGIQTCLTIFNGDNTKLNINYTEYFFKTVSQFQTLHRVFAYFVFLIEFACGFYMYYEINPNSGGLLLLFGLFMVAVFFIVLILYHLIDFLLTPITGKNVNLNFDNLERLGKYDLLKVAAYLFSIFFTLAVYQWSRNVKTTMFFGIIMLLLTYLTTKNSEQRQIYEPNTKDMQSEIDKLKTENARMILAIEARK